MERTYKVITLGSYGVGKTCILLKATEENFSFPNTYVCTIGVDSKTKLHAYEGLNVKFTIWDTAGQERFHNINRYYYNDCQAVFLVYDVTNPDSFDKVSFFLEDFTKNSSNIVSFILVGNKKDSNDRKVAFEQGQNYAKKIGAPFIECSAKTGENIEELFDLVLVELKSKEIEPAQNKNLYIVKTVKKEKRCCE